MQKQRRRKRETADDIHQKIIELGNLQWTPTQIHRYLMSRPEFEGRVQSLKTVQRILKEDVVPRAEGNSWSFAETVVDVDDPANARLVMDQLAFVWEESKGRISSVTRGEAEWIIRLKTAYPEMPPNAVWAFTREGKAIDYAKEIGRDPDDLALDPFYELFIAMQAWRDRENRLRYHYSWQSAEEQQASIDPSD